jgi:hypothetical protein
MGSPFFSVELINRNSVLLSAWIDPPSVKLANNRAILVPLILIDLDSH